MTTSAIAMFLLPVTPEGAPQMHIQEALPCIREASKNGALLLYVGHFGRYTHNPQLLHASVQSLMQLIDVPLSERWENFAQLHSPNDTQLTASKMPTGFENGFSAIGFCPIPGYPEEDAEIKFTFWNCSPEHFVVPKLPA